MRRQAAGIWYNDSMKKLILFSALFFVWSAATAAEPAPESAPAIPTGTKPALASARFNGNLNEAALYKSVLDYSLPPEVAATAQKCVTAHPDECYIALKAYENSDDPQQAAAANLELAVLAMQRGQTKRALSYLDKAAALRPEDPFIQLTQGWFLVSVGKYKKARKSFESLLYLTADFEYVSSAKLGNALAWYLSGNKEKAATELQYLYTSNPYAISFVSYLLGDIASHIKKTKKLAPVFLQQSLSHDERNYAAAALFAQLSEKEKNKLHAWQYYATLYSLDPNNKKLAKKMAKYSKDFGDKSIDYLFYLRLEQPIVHVMPSTPSEMVKMALYANAVQEPQALLSAAVMGSGAITVTDTKLGEILHTPPYIEKTISFNQETGGVDVKDARGHVEFSTKRPFTFSLDKDKFTLLVRNVRAANIFEADLSDKELKGALTVIPQENGFRLVNQTYAEDLIPALLATQAQEVKHKAALTALAVVFRSLLSQQVQQQTDAPYHITDNDPLFKFAGINLVFKDLLDASQTSSTIRLTQAPAGFYTDCGVLTEDGLENTAQKPAYIFSPANVSKYILSNPPEDLFSRPQDPTHWAGIKWIYLYEAKDITARIALQKDIGKLRAIVPVQYTPAGRILAVRFEGSKGSYETTSPQETSFLLSASTLRSNLFDVIPLYKGKNIRRVIVRGYDTGNGEGLCLHGADGLAKKGSDYMAIIKYYFPYARIINTSTGQVY